MGLFSKSIYKINGDTCTVTFNDPGELTEERVNKILDKPKVKACKKIEAVIGEKVTAIGEKAFYNCTSLTSIKIPDSVTAIGYWAFDGCTSLASIEIPDSVTTIGEDAFYYCTSLTIYCEAPSKPENWHGKWNSANRPALWGHRRKKGKQLND